MSPFITLNPTEIEHLLEKPYDPVWVCLSMG